MLMAITIPVFLWLAKWNGIIDIFSREFGQNVVLFFVDGIIGTLLALFVFSYIYDILKLNDLRKGILFIGNYSLYYLAIHQQLIIHPLNSMGIIISNPVINFVMRYILSLAGSTIITIVIINCRNRWKSKKSIV